MRVIAGKARGHKLFSLAGNATRPTTDRVKEAAFSIIQNYISESVVLDLFAGSGALGIEAISRGAAFCDFVEVSKQAAEITRKNIQKTHFEELCKLNVTSFEQFLNSADKKYQIILLDPPYHHLLCDKAIEMIAKRGLLSNGGIIMCEVASDEFIQSPYHLKREAVYGNTKILIFEE